MDENLLKSINEYYIKSKIFDILYCKETKDLLEEEYSEELFLWGLNFIINYNSENNVMTDKEKDKIYKILIELRFHNPPLIDPEEYVELINKVRLAKSINCELFLQEQFLLRYDEPHYNGNNVTKYCYKDIVKLFEIDLKLIEILKLSDDEFQERKEEILESIYYLHCLVGLIKAVPEVLDNKILFGRIQEILQIAKKELRFNFICKIKDPINSYAIKLVKQIKNNS